VARDRKRAKQRQRRRGAAPGGAGGQLHRADLPGALEHSSSASDEFDAALVKGAEGAPDAQEQPADPDREREQPEEQPQELELTQTSESQDADVVEVTQAPRQRESLVRRTGGFFRSSWAELQRMQWPDRPQVFQATAVVLGFVAIAGAYLGVADWVAQKIVNFIL
jgi:preprotein translocase subunit SecE